MLYAVKSQAEESFLLLTFCYFLLDLANDELLQPEIYPKIWLCNYEGLKLITQLKEGVVGYKP